ncbi:MAG: hypothetical protein EBW07_00355 [Rhodobacteraceae bacterium]|nr:hypothetical protein [Paracoccaceae bacterium]
MIRSELVQIIADENPHLFQRDVERIVNTVFDEITNALAEAKAVPFFKTGKLLRDRLNGKES